jgi:hypothetical protein
VPATAALIGRFLAFPGKSFVMLPDPRAGPGSAGQVSERFGPESNYRIAHRSPHPL